MFIKPGTPLAVLPVPPPMSNLGLSSLYVPHIHYTLEYSSSPMPQENSCTNYYSNNRPLSVVLVCIIVYVFIGDSIALVDFVRLMYNAGMLSQGNYVIISVDDEVYNLTMPYQYMLQPSDYKFIEIDGDIPTLSITEPFRSVLKVTPYAATSSEYADFKAKLKIEMAKFIQIPYNEKIFDTVQVPIYAAYAYDAVMIYARALSEVLAKGDDPRNGTDIFNHIRGRSFESIQGSTVFVDENGDSEGNYTVLALVEDHTSPAKRRMKPVGGFIYRENSSIPEFHLTFPIHWIGDKPPSSIPPCGFEGEICISKPDWKVIAICSVCGCIVIIAAIFVVRHYRYEHKLACLLWKIDMKDVTIIPTDSDQMLANKSTVSWVYGFIR
uniref:Receptor ligand binding region domain-containing protein n=1 Tax=Strigamia maritima TaxID=126957 RepID=T1JKS6_STRMM